MKSPRELFQPGAAALHIAALFTLSVAQPIYNLFARTDHSTFFVAYQAKAIDIWLLVVVLSLLLPLGLALILWATTLMSRYVAKGLCLSLFFILLAALLLPACERLLPQSGDLSIAIGLGASAITTFLYSYYKPVRFFVSLMSVSIIVAPVLFLTSSPIRSFLWAPENQGYDILSRNNQLPNIVMLVFDELPLTSLLNEDRLVDKVRYPNFYRLAQSSTWYRNAAATHTYTRASIPAILTGMLNVSGKENSENPDNIFTLLAATHRIVAMEHATNLSRAFNDENAPASALVDRFAGEMSDVALVYAHLALPRRFRSGLPAIDNQWNHFTAQGPNYPELDLTWPYQGYWPQEVRRFLALLEGSSFPPKFYFLHLLMPHQPFNYDHQGKQHSYKLPTVSRLVTGKNEIASEQIAALVYQAHLLKLSFGDRLLGHIFQRLDELSLFESSLIIIAADHGISFYWDGEGDEEKLRKIQSEDLANIPLFIKLPQQTKGEISDAPVQTHDILPTVADILKITIPWRTDEISVFDTKPTRKRFAFLPEKIELDTVIEPQHWSLHRKLELFGHGFDGLYNYGPHGDLIGQPVERFGTQVTTDSLVIAQLEDFQNVKPASASLPGYIEGKIFPQAGHSVDLDSSNLVLAIVVNGIIRTTTRVWKDADALYFLCRLPPDSFKEGANEIGVYGVEADEEGRVASLVRFVVK